ncbi:nucleotide sugar dehydrogenase [Candidatus Chlorohelix sp.]|uniref:nucleotide sugar dehydrogenase n=1 Tax=Candidatus Chlorohelix sp. TaxID=3139201 RepID=UPI003046E2A1
MLIDKINNKQAKIGIIGLGYVGLPVGVAYAEAGFRVTGLDVSQARVKMLNRGESYIDDILSERLLPILANGSFKASFDPSVLAAQDAIIICVPTPLNKTQDPDLAAIKAATKDIAANLQRGQLIVLESTTYPGTTQEVIQPILESRGMKVGEDFFLAFSPERIDPGAIGSKGWRFENTPKVVGGVTPQCRELASTLYSKVVEKVVPVSSPSIAEMTKIFENVFRVVNVALVNEMALLCDRMGLDVWEVLRAANTKPFGIMQFAPGPGVGGHCIPIDPFYLTWKAREYDFHTRFIELAGEINLQMPYHVRELTIRALNRSDKGLHGAKILVLGVAYKKDVSDFRESPAIKIISLLEKDGAHITYHDPHVPELKEGNTTLQSVKLDQQTLNEADCVLIITDHSAFDYETIVRESKVIVDTRNATAKVGENRDKIVLL